jgi:hypothetical protein
MIASLKPNTLLPADPLGQRLCETFGRYLWNCIRAELPDDATAKPAWQTITKYELRPRVLWNDWQDAQVLIGVRFAHETTYGLLDIDAGSEYCTAEGIADLRAALETIGITRTILTRSSWSGGLHRFPQVAEPAPVRWLDEVAQGCRRQLQRLGWSAEQLVQFIAEKFDGKRRAQLSDDELILLLYHLRSIEC